MSASTTNATTTVDGPAGIPAHRQVSGGRINPDARAFVRVIIIGTVIAGTVAFAISFVALMEIAHWLGIPSWMSWSIPVFIDLAILIYAGSILVHKARGDRTWRSWVMLGVFTGLSMVANVSHALSSGTSTEAWQAWVGAVIAGMVPIAIFAATEQLASIAVQDPETRRAELEAEATWAAEQADREREQIGLEHEREMARQRAELDREQHVTEIEIARARRSHLVEKAAQGIDLDHSPTDSSPTEPRPTPNRTKSPSPARATADLDAIASFVEEAQYRGERVSGAALAEAGLVSSGKTGQRRLASLKKQRPDLFEAEDPTPGPEDDTAAADEGTT
ncbi:DUF2637 domain-containing protein [Nesterenkonia marinintestina]|uniref:DUF2637 domain-containing protein n=1 Tax=Nesterenkonia marinintestina TaxID=2979865 RepID=UPI0021BFD7D5|nr:DUF2637 domain-containing protein [Nesterenkonia sp. GX14115]